MLDRQTSWALASLRDENHGDKQKSLHFEAIFPAIAHWLDCFGGQFKLSRYFKSRKEARAFTLAEVLITLGIIGVIAAMTIPTLMKNYQKQETAIRLKKIFSLMSATFRMAEVEQGNISTWSAPTANWDANASKAWWLEYVIPYLSTGKSCVSNNASQCWDTTAKYLDGSSFNIGAGMCTFILKDGSSVYLSGVSDTMAQFFVDINGLKEPNVVGKDMFFMILNVKKGPLEFGGQGYSKTYLLGDNGSSCNKAPGSTKGAYCGELIRKAGWEIEEAYPWD